jgi:hypothetical protein
MSTSGDAPETVMLSRRADMQFSVNRRREIRFERDVLTLNRLEAGELNVTP